MNFIVVCSGRMWETDKLIIIFNFETFLKGIRCKVAPGWDMRLPRNGDMCRCFGAEIKFNVY